jgi:hypothetical protein
MSKIADNILECMIIFQRILVKRIELHLNIGIVKFQKNCYVDKVKSEIKL